MLHECSLMEKLNKGLSCLGVKGILAWLEHTATACGSKVQKALENQEKPRLLRESRASKEG